MSKPNPLVGLFLLQLILIALKAIPEAPLAGASWWLVLLPLVLYLATWVVMTLAVLVIGTITLVMGAIAARKTPAKPSRSNVVDIAGGKA